MSDESTPNVALLDEVMEQIEESHARQQGIAAHYGWLRLDDRADKIKDRFWDQSIFRAMVGTNDCGTAMCFAGYACDVSGVRWGGLGSDVYDPETGEFMGYADEAAQDLLGLAREQARALFFADNSIEDLRRIVAEIKGES